MSEDCWEARMSARAKARQEAARAAQRAQANQRIQSAKRALPGDRSWLNGWPALDGDLSVLMGTGVHCIGCGWLLGVTTVVFDEGWEPPGPEPEWPFAQDDCPICPERRVVALDS